jgi:predicted RNA-binding Zn-ribbon protein involved in translation (DUF1610 family)
MERRRHPHYARNTFGVSLALAAGGLGCLLLGIAVRGTRYFGLETIFNLAFVAFAVGLVIYWFKQGETTTCPTCGGRMFADPNRDRERNLAFTCHTCQIEWDTDGLHDM